MVGWQVLHTGRVGERVSSTVALIEDGPSIVVIDPGMVPAQDAILSPLAAAGYQPSQVTDVVVSHHHPDHTMNVGLFPQARLHDHWAVYHLDVWDSQPAEGRQVSEHLWLIETPGHTAQDITSLFDAEDETIAFTHLWWRDGGPPEDRLATDPTGLHRGRERVLRLASLIVPGHGAPFRPDERTYR